MAAPPAKRQRKLVVLSSSDNEDSIVPSPSVDLTSPERKSTSLVYTLSFSIRFFLAFKLIFQTYSRSAVNTSISSSCENPSKRSKTTASTTTKSKMSEKTKSRASSRKQPKDSKVPTSPSPKKKTRQQRQLPSESTRSLHNFFQPATDEQRWSFTKSDAGLRQAEEASSFAEELEDDLIEDDWLEDDWIDGSLESARCLDKPSNELAIRDSANKNSTMASAISKTVSRTSSKRFILDDDEVVKRTDVASTTEEPGRKPWSDQYPPTLLDQLAVHKKKVADVRQWLSIALSGRTRHKILVLHGPAGCGKTATVSLLSDELNFDIVDWKNPFGTDTGNGQYSSLSSQFDYFLGQLNSFGGLDLSDSSAPSASKTHITKQTSSPSAQKRVILIEEFPANLSWGSTALSSFQTSLRRYLASSSSNSRNIFGNTPDTTPPIVIIISETMLGTSGATSENLTAHRLLGPEVYTHPGTTTIEFNPIAPTFMLKALQLILRKEANQSKRQWIPGIEVLKKLSELGDIRSAISALEFLCLRNDTTNQGWSGRVAWKSSKTTAPLTAMEKESLELITQRETSLGLFHAVGKVVYNKRDETIDPAETGQELHVAPPSHLMHLDRPKVSQVSVEDMMDKTGTDVHIFTAALHENYPPSCDGPTFTETLEGCIEHLSDSDILGSETRSFLYNSRNGIGTARGRFLGYGISVDRLRQDEISFHVAVRGMLFSLPYPVRRKVDQSSFLASSTKGKRVGPYKLYYPTSQRLWKNIEEVDGLVNLWERQLLLDPSGIRHPGQHSVAAVRDGGVASWKANAMNSNLSLNTNSKQQDNDSQQMPFMMSREDMLLYYLPYLSKIMANNHVSSPRGLDRITQFKGIHPPAEEDFLEDDAQEEIEGTNSHRPGIRRLDTHDVVEKKEDQLFLSDDDIED
ncbi:cell cycle checkpoint protein Rad17, putative [Talaromyces stipitatus ATCC 10500]|uniref:Cell cycle checkpoint protein Rad17, putative n=1 Tax=Talaromyces stipitatus (strain ATCC 10500 / CBS 375.48 / QM 6759 / NRRL 1006) TaxID=441959 RepID=B8MG85_TALSN|nr:cell cycle checkpoint protein Rad17, putative [Talaromyces stipitatus ATCC 10500]EED15952.1 cell cycle checkpoint protein Rad17, putative [Talaromyces stipitatus ATCC 10500]